MTLETNVCSSYISNILFGYLVLILKLFVRIHSYVLIEQNIMTLKVSFIYCYLDECSALLQRHICYWIEKFAKGLLCHTKTSSHGLIAHQITMKLKNLPILTTIGFKCIITSHFRGVSLLLFLDSLILFLHIKTSKL